MRWLMIAVAITAFALVGAGCGGDDESAADTDTTTITETTGTEETTTDETTTDETEEGETETDASGSFATEDCLEAIGAFSKLGQALAASGSSTDDVEESSRIFQAFADAAPDEIREDFRVLADAYADYIEVLSGLDLQSGEIPSAEQLQELQQAAEPFNRPEVIAASDRVSAWTTANCSGG
ncbi:MAG: hypothetical protein A2Y55_13675 [Actinobacteria bacterium RBG_16_68_12]|nr:MAG: hypothetical protein A2Y55_13675 [Actinobacteria bacterium RBG_16_68_12]